MRQQPITRGQRAIWRNVNARYPGFSEDVSDYFWKLADEDRLEAGTPEFVRMLLAKWPDGIDVSDLSHDRPDGGAKWTTDSELVQQWTVKVSEYHRVVESILDGEELLPLQGSEWQHLSRLVAIKDENLNLKNYLRDIEISMGRQSETIDNLPHKSKNSIYTIIYSVAKKHGYVFTRNNSATKIISGIVADAGFSLNEQTILKTIRDAHNFLEGND